MKKNKYKNGIECLKNAVMEWGEADDKQQRKDAKKMEFALYSIDAISETAACIAYNLGQEIRDYVMCRRKETSLAAFSVATEIAEAFNEKYPYNSDWEELCEKEKVSDWEELCIKFTRAYIGLQPQEKLTDGDKFNLLESLIRCYAERYPGATDLLKSARELQSEYDKPNHTEQNYLLTPILEALIREVNENPGFTDKIIIQRIHATAEKHSHWVFKY